jgi:maleylpyruvate isomerase
MTPDNSTARLSLHVGWMRDGEGFLAAQLAGAPLRQPSLLPGWTRAHVAAHLIGNARGLVNLLHWANTGEETPMYPNAHARARDIDEWSQRPDAQLKTTVQESADALKTAASALPAQAWTTTVRTALGREIPAAEVVWLRTRETWIHGIDLATGAWFNALPGPLIDALLADVCATIGTRPDCPPVTLTAEDRARTWAIGPTDTEALKVSGTASELLAWLTGRTRGQRPAVTVKHELPILPAWL